MDQGVLAADYRPSAGVRLRIQAYDRGFDRLLLVAPRAGEPFATSGFVVGSGASRGMSLDAAVSSRRFGAFASYGMQSVRRAYGDSSYVPGHGATHLLEGGVTAFPTATLSIRLGAAGAFGRRTTAASGGLEWESCNLLDRGCEFRGSPHLGSEPLGAAPLPSYFRVDIGVRKHWRVGIGGRDGVIALFATITNVFDRKNVLTYSREPATGALTPVELRPRAPLVIGLDWRF